MKASRFIFMAAATMAALFVSLAIFEIISSTDLTHTPSKSYKELPTKWLRKTA